jgi:hypothetical protein
MDELGNWVYIILMAVVGISSFIRSVNKKSKQSQTHVPVPQPPEPSFPMPSFPAPPVPKRKRVISPPPVQADIFNPSVVSQLSVSGSDDLLDEMLPIGSKEDISMIQTLNLNDPNNIRQAIIFAEIINRKHT